MFEKIIVMFVLLVIRLFVPFSGTAQVSAPGAGYSGLTSYPSFPQNDPLFVFCAGDSEPIASLRATTAMTGNKTFEWQKYDPQTGTFGFYFSENIAGNQSQVGQLSDGCYRVTITQGSQTEVYRAWVFNNRIQASTEIAELQCTMFTLRGNASQPPLTYYDIQSNAPVTIAPDFQAEWRQGDAVITRMFTTTIFEVPYVETKYNFRVSNQFGCSTVSEISYSPIGTKAEFSVTPEKGEAPLEVTFTNKSLNGDNNGYEWFFFRELDEIKRESEGRTTPVDSFMFVAYDQQPVYTYENSGMYMVKLVSKKVTQNHVCTDTFYLPNYIIADTSFVAVPNVFTPNGDGDNDNLVIKFWSMKEIKISIFNRWGRTVHVWQSNNIRGFSNTWQETVWDGKIGGRYASPGVYFYVVEGVGRDDRKQRKNGFIHLFRDKD